MLKNIVKNKNGVTLIEMVVAVTLFSVVILSSTEIFKMVIEGQRNAIASQNVQESMRYAFETMAKEIRMATLSNHDCEYLFSVPVTAQNKIYNITSNGEGEVLYFKNKNDVCTAYYLENGAIMVARGGDTALTTPAKIRISNLNFEVIDDQIGTPANVQPMVTMRMDIEATGKEMHKETMKMQTTLSSRYYE
ncbi:MAG: prepilin-type N-terminal cleavage/methylation domain-containing protein [Patescibacteria group bacterium]